MKKMLIIMIFSSIVFGQYHMQSSLSIKDGVKVADFEKAMIHHNKAHQNELGAVNTFVVLNGPNVGQYVRMHQGLFPIPADQLDAIYNAHSNHEPVPYDKWNDSMIVQESGTQFYTVRGDLSYNMQYKSDYKYLTMSVFQVAQGGNAYVEGIFRLMNGVREEIGSTEHFVVMQTNTGGSFNEYVFVTGHDTMLEAVDQSEFLKALGTLTAVKPGWDKEWGDNVWGGYSQTMEFKPLLSTQLD
jgi:hypothetical protein